jgi:hypothetical protein
MCMYVYMYVCIYVSERLICIGHVHLCEYVCIKYMCVCVPAGALLRSGHTRTCSMYVCMYVYVCMFLTTLIYHNIHLYVCSSMRVCVCIYIYIYMLVVTLQDIQTGCICVYVYI